MQIEEFMRKEGKGLEIMKKIDRLRKEGGGHNRNRNSEIDR